MVSSLLESRGTYLAAGRAKHAPPADSFLVLRTVRTSVPSSKNASPSSDRIKPRDVLRCYGCSGRSSS